VRRTSKGAWILGESRAAGLSGLLMGGAWMWQVRWNFAEDQLTKDASVIQELVRTGAA